METLIVTAGSVMNNSGSMLTPVTIGTQPTSIIVHARTQLIPTRNLRIKPSACNTIPQELIKSDQKYKPLRRLKVRNTTMLISTAYTQATAVPAARIQYCTGLYGRAPEETPPAGATLFSSMSKSIAGGKQEKRYVVRGAKKDDVEGELRCRSKAPTQLYRETKGQRTKDP